MISPFFFLPRFTRRCFATNTLSMIGVALFMLTQFRSTDAFVHYVDDYLTNVEPGRDTTKAIQALIDELTAHEVGGQIVFGEGPYYLEAPPDKTEVITLNNTTNLTLSGNSERGTRLIITNPHQGFIRALDGTGLVVSGFTIDYDPLPFTQGTIRHIADDGAHFVLEIDESFPDLRAAHFQKMPHPSTRFGLVIDRELRRVKEGVMDHFFIEGFEEVEPRLWQIEVAPAYRIGMENVAPGDSFVLLSRTVREAGLIVARSRNTLLRDITFHASPGLAFVPMESEQTELVNCNVLFPDNTLRLITGNADGVHAVDHGAGLTIRDSKFEGMADDGINVYSVPGRVQKILSDNSVIVTGGSRWSGGQRVQVLNPDDGVYFGEVLLRSVEPGRNPGERILEFIPSASGITEETLLMNVDLAAPSLTIQNCSFVANRRHAIYVKSSYAMIHENRIVEPGAFGIVVANEPNWPEGPIPSNVVIRNNTITGGAYSAGYVDLPEGAAIQVMAMARNHRPAKGQPVSNIRIMGNQLIDQRAASIYVAAATNVTIEANTINDTLFAPSVLRQAPVVIEQCANVSILMNNITLEGALPAAAIEWRTVSHTPNPDISSNKIQIPPGWEVIVGSRDH